MSSGVNIYKETKNKLKLLVVLNSLEEQRDFYEGGDHRTVLNSGASEIHCFSSENGTATLFLEASSYNLGIIKQVVDINYVLEPLPSNQPEGKWEGKIFYLICILWLLVKCNSSNWVDQCKTIQVLVCCFNCFVNNNIIIKICSAHISTLLGAQGAETEKT